jgi:hypothetical protein
LSAESVQELGEIMINNNQCKHLTLLHFYNNMSGTPGAIAFSKIISHFPEIQDLRFSATRAGAEGCLEIAKVTFFFVFHFIIFSCFVNWS